MSGQVTKVMKNEEAEAFLKRNNARLQKREAAGDLYLAPGEVWIRAKAQGSSHTRLVLTRGACNC